MKKITAVILVVILALTLISCSGGNSASTSPSAAASTAPSAAASKSPSASASASPSSSSSPSASATSTVGYVTDKVDYFKRKPYKFATLSLNTATTYNKMINDNYANWGKVMNYTLFNYDAHMDYDGYINEISVLASQGYNGLFCGLDDALNPRVFELTQELKIACIGMPTAFTDKDSHVIWPSVNQDEYGNGAICTQWLADNYKNYWKDQLDKSKLGLITIDFSPVSGIHARVPGIKDKFDKLYPEASKNYYTADLVTNSNGFSNQAANEMTASIIAAHPEVTKWFVVACVDDWAVGATRAVEALNKAGDVLIVSVQADAFVNEMQSGYSGNVYVAGNAISTVDLTGLCAANLVSILDGRATAATIWPDQKKAGEKYPCIYVKGTMLTKDTYKSWQQKESFDTKIAGLGLKTGTVAGS